jgi:hypothetical protein
MERQLALIEVAKRDWRLDEHTREVGRQGVAQAREALREALHRAEHQHRSAEHHSEEMAAA